MLRLVIIDEDSRETTVPFIRDEISIGRKEGNTIRLVERNISRHHAVLTRENGDTFIDDLDSYNGVVLNGNRIARKVTIYPGDILEIGDYKIRMEEGPGELRPKVDLDQDVIEILRQEMGPEDSQMIDQIMGRIPDLPAEKDLYTGEAALSESSDDSVEDTKLEDLDTDSTILLPILSEKSLKGEPGSEKPEHLSMDISTAAEKLLSLPLPGELDQLEIDHNAETKPVPLDDEAADGGKTDVGEESNEAASPPEAVPDLPYELVMEADPESATQKLKVFTASLKRIRDLEDWTREIPHTKSRKTWLLLLFVLATATGAYFAFSGPSMEQEDPLESPPLVMPPSPVEPEPVPDKEMVEKADRNARIAIEKSMAAKKEALAAEAKEAAVQEQALSNEIVKASFTEANSLMGEQRWGEAERTLNMLLEDIPEAAEAKQLRDRARGEKRNKIDYQNGIKALAKNNSFQAVSLLGGIGHDSYYYPIAKEKLASAKAKMASEYTTKGWRDYRKAQYQDALAEAEKVLVVNPGHEDARKLKRAAQIKIKAEKGTKSTKASKQKMTARQHYNVAINYHNKKQFKDAVRHFSTAVEIDPRFAFAWRGLGACYAQMKQMKEAMHAYQQYVNLKPNSTDAEQVRKIIEAYKKSGQ